MAAFSTSPTLTRPSQALNFKVLPHQDMPRMLAAPPPVVDGVRDWLRQLKASLIQG